jgi:hypothetical protein
MVAEEHVCKYGRITFYDCGTIAALNYDPDEGCVKNSGSDFVVAAPNPGGGDMSEPGDSGMPVFHDDPAKAYGEGICDWDSNWNVVFMAQNYFSNIGVRVDID